MPLPVDLEIQPQEAPLNDKARIALQTLSRKYQDDKDLEKKLKDVAVTIAEATHKINETAYHKKKKHDNKLAKLAARDEEEDEDEKQEYDTFQVKVADLTKKMDHSMRKTIDNRIWSEALPENVRHVSTGAIDVASQPTQRTTQYNDDSDDEDDETVQATTVAHEDTPTALLQAALSSTKSQWTTKSLTARYAHDPSYASFYSSLWDAQHPTENAPPLPAPALWFVREENPSAPLGTQASDDAMNGNGDGDDTDIVLATERISLKCPITLQHYRDPVTSSICNHSFERNAIFDMLKLSTDHVPFTPTQTAELSQLSRAERAWRENALRVQRVRCPTSGCDKFFTETDLHPNRVLLRKVNRELETQRKANAERDGYDDDDDEDEDELQGPRGTQRKPFGLDGTSSPPPMSAKRERRLKSERRSVIPQTQIRRTTAEGATVVDLDDDE